MIRKLAIVLGATAVIGAAALAPTAASAHWKGNHRHSGVGIVVASPLFFTECGYVKQTVLTKHGWRIRYIKVCNY